MQLFPPGKIYDFMKYRWLFGPLSVLITVIAFGSLFYPGPVLGTDFRGGTEVEVAFLKEVQPNQLREAIEKANFSSPDIVGVSEGTTPHRFMIRVQEISTIDEEKQQEVEQSLCFGDNLAADRCPAELQASEVKFSPGGDKISVRYRNAPDLERIRQQISGVKDIALRESANAIGVQNAREHRVEILLKSRGDQIMDVLRAELGADVVPDSALRMEWIGPKAGAQLRDAGVKSVVLALVFITVYIAFRFDLRFAPGALISLAHDAIITMGVLVLLRKEVGLSTVAGILTIITYSVNDTVVVFDRVRENFQRMRGSSFVAIINTSLSEMLGRTLITGVTTIFSLVFFFVWGTGELKDFALTLVIGFTVGIYSSIYIALPLTEWFDRKILSRFVKKNAKRKPARKVSDEAVV